jgi:ribosomal protein S18 acetylase RimI-like enzyme
MPEFVLSPATSPDITLSFYHEGDDVGRITSLAQFLMDEMVSLYGNTDRQVGEPVENDYFNDSYIILAKNQNGYIVGLLGLRFLSIVNQPDHNAYIFLVGVDPIARNQGVGKDLMVNALAFARHFLVKRIILDVSENNTPAKRLYATLGGETMVRTVSFPV